jgi:uncharacterized protein involved in outer membrane biogenesis
MQRHPKAITAGAIVLGLVVVAVAFLMLFDFKGFIERRATTAMGRPVTIGALNLGVFPLEAIIVDLNVADEPAGVPPANEKKSGSPKPPFMKAEHVDAVVGFWRLLGGNLHFKYLSVENAVARVERKADGTLTWEIDQPQLDDKEKRLALPEIRDLRLHNVKVLYRDPSTKTQLTLDLETNEGKPNKDGSVSEPTLTVKGQGTYADQPTTITATGGSILTLRDTEHPYPIDGTMVSGQTSISAKGTVVDPANITGLNVTLAIKGQDAADLYRVAGIALPPTPPYVINTHLDRDGARWIFKNLNWTMGKSDFAGELVWDLREETPLLTGTLKAKAVAFDDLGGFIGAAPGEAKTPVEERRQAAERERTKRVAAPEPEQSVATELVIPDKTLDLEKLVSMNAKVHLEADKIVESKFPLDSFKTDIVLLDGVLTLKPLVFTVDHGLISIDLTINGKARPVKTTVAATIQGFPLGRLVGKSGGENTSWGAIGGHAEFQGTGDSMHRILASSNGQVGLAVGGGELSLFLVELMGVDIAELLGIIITKDKPTAIRCIVGDFALENGKMTARTMVADTDDTIFRGNGSIDLGREVMEMRIHAKPKDFSPATLRSKLLLAGTFAHPTLGPDKKAMMLQGGIAAVLGVTLTPLASLIALIDFGGGKDANCAALMKEAEK